MPPKSRPRSRLKSTQSVPLTEGSASSKSRRLARGSQLLVVDPNEETRRMVVDHYDAQGWRVREAATTRDAIDVALEQQPDVMIVEFYMPQVEARHLFRTLRSSVEHDVVIVGLATPSPLLAEQTRHSSADVVLAKPIDLNAIDAVVNGPKSP
jgi:CheY-like chemotaxis protein